MVPAPGRRLLATIPAYHTFAETTVSDVPIPPSIDMWIFAGAGLGALLTWMIMRLVGRNAYQHGFDHGRLDAEGDFQDRLRASEQDRARLQADLERVTRDVQRLAAPVLGRSLGQDGQSPHDPRNAP